MKKQSIITAIAGLVIFLFLGGCSNVSMTSWKNPKMNEQISKVLVWGMFQKLEYEKPFEDAVVQYFQSKGLKSVQALHVLNPNVKYQHADLERIIDSVGADGILIFSYKGTQKEQDYVPPSTTIYPDYYWNYYGYYNWYYPYYGPGYYGPGYNVYTTGGYWTTTTIVNLVCNLYGNRTDDMLWTSEISVTNPNYIDAAGNDIARQIYKDWSRAGLLKYPTK